MQWDSDWFMLLTQATAHHLIRHDLKKMIKEAEQALGLPKKQGNRDLHAFTQLMDMYSHSVFSKPTFLQTFSCSFTLTRMVGPRGVRLQASVQQLAVCNTCNRLVLLMVGNKSPPPLTKSPPVKHTQFYLSVCLSVNISLLFKQIRIIQLALLSWPL